MNMQYTQAKQGRIFVLRMEHGEVVHEIIEKFAQDQGIRAAAFIILGGAEQGSRLVVGPEDGQASPVTPIETVLDDVHEVAGTGTLFPDEKGNLMLHMHMACGRKNSTTTGCIRAGVRVWHVMEVVVFELLNIDARRVLEPKIGFPLLQPRA
jgi:predicted DNA-binding protein with PD1-like motif